MNKNAKETKGGTRTAPTQEQTPAEQLQWAKYLAAADVKAVFDASERAIETLLRAASDAQRALERARANPNQENFGGSTNVTKLPQEVLHAASWGLANATSDIETAMSYSLKCVTSRAKLAEAQKAFDAATPVPASTTDGTVQS